MREVQDILRKTLDLEKARIINAEAKRRVAEFNAEYTSCI